MPSHDDYFITIMIIESALLILCLIFLAFVTLRLNRNKVAHKILEDGFNSTGNGFLIFNEDGSLFKANTAARKFLGDYERNDHKTCLENFIDLMFDHAIECDEQLERVVEKSSSEFQKDSANFQEVVLLHKNTPCLVVGHQTQNSRFIFTIVDISQRKYFEEIYSTIDKTNYALNNAIESANIGVIISEIHDQRPVIKYTNQTLRSILNKSLDILYDQDLSVLHESFPDPDLQNAIELCIENNESYDHLLKQCKDGTTQWFTLNITPIVDKENGNDLLICFLSDITGFKSQENEFFQSQKLEALGQLSAGLAHDFNNLLSIIQGYSNLALKKSTNEELSESLERISTTAKRGSDLTKRMLNFSKRQFDKEGIINIQSTILDQEVLLRPLVGPSIHLNFDINDEEIFVEAQDDMIAQILMNLIINARDALQDIPDAHIKVTSQKSTIIETKSTISKFKQGISYVTMCVSDNGSGMDEETKSKIFNPFFTTKQPENGTGLGLSVVQKIVAQLNGIMEIETAVNKGSNFIIHLPISKKKHAKQVIGNLEDISSISFQGYTTLIVDDEPDILDILTETLQDAGMKVLQASNGDDALVVQDDYSDEIDLLVTDIRMPGLNGIHLAELFGSLRPNAEIVLMSGYPNSSTDPDTKIPKDTNFIAKPFANEDLLIYLLNILQKNKIQNTQVRSTQKQLQKAS